MLICLLLGAITLGLYWTTVRFNFIDFDDNEYVTLNSHVQAGLTWDGIEWAFTTGEASNWHPLTWISHMLDCQLYGLKPGGHHLTNAILHAFNVMMLFLVLLRMTGATWQSCVVAALFAWHPAHVESVAWVAERKDVLSTFFGLVTMLAYTFYAREPKTKNTATIYYCLALLSFALSLLSKSMLVTLPFVLLLLDYWPLRRMRLFGAASAGKGMGVPGAEQKGPVALLQEKVPFFVLVFLSCVLTVWAQQRVGSVMSDATLPLSGRVAHALVSYVKYVKMMFLPVKLAIFYPHTGAPTMSHAAVAFLVLAGISFAAVQWLRDAPFFPVGWFWFLGTLVPVIGVLQVGSQAMADRYTYFPYVGLFVAIVWGAGQLWERWKPWCMALNAATAALLAVMLFVTRTEIGYWQNDITLFGHAREVTSYNFMACSVLGDALEQAGKNEEAIAYLKEGLTYMPSYPPLHFLLGRAYLEQGKLNDAIASFSEAIRLRPNSPQIYQKLGMALFRQGRLDEALGQFSTAARMDPADSFSECQIALICSQKKDLPGAIQHYHASLSIQPDNIEALNNLAWILAASENSEFRNGAEAVQLAQRACEATHNSEPALLGTLAAAYAEAGQFTNAVATATKARDLALTANLKSIADRNQKLLELYRSGQPFHESGNTRASSR